VIDRAARSVVCAVLERISVGELTIVDGPERLVFGSGTPRATILVRSSRTWPALLRGSRGLAESYRDGLWDSPDLTAVIRVAALNVHGLDGWRRRLTVVREPWQRVRGAFVRNTPRRSRIDIAAHYDLGDELFDAMLDPTMMYSSAVFDGPGTGLEQAALTKLERVCAILDIGPDDHVVEIGTGWGGFAVYAAMTRGCRVTTTTLSRDQHARAVARARDAGVGDRVTVLLEDYRDVRGRYDKLVSIEMIEAVGWKDFGTFFARCSELLHPDGTMLLQAITMDDRAYAVERASKSFIRTFIFPNGCLPSREVIAREIARRTDLTMVALDDITPHYAETLMHWRANVERSAAELEQHGYDERFRRLWRLYLCYCEAGFAERRIGCVQAVFAKPGWRSEIRRPAAASASELIPLRAARRT
jgi:cyclopropane-fatty-acyl-phospholipid synthase